MRVKNVERTGAAFEGAAEVRGPVQASERRARKVGYRHAIAPNGRAQRHVEIFRAVDARRVDLHLVSGCGQRSAQAMDGMDRPSVAPRRSVRGYDVQDAHVYDTDPLRRLP